MFQKNIKDVEITYPVNLKPIIQQLRVSQGSDGVVEFSSWYEQLEAYFAEHRVLKALFHEVQYEPVCSQFMNEDNIWKILSNHIQKPLNNVFTIYTR